MIDKTETFSFTFLYRSDNEKVILIKQGEIPAKSEDEADTVLTSSNPDDVSAIDGIVSKITPFNDAEPGSEPTITETLQELEDKYNISLEELEEETGEDLDGDNEHMEHDEHIEKALDNPDMENEHEEYSLTDPLAMMPEHKNKYTNPDSFLEEDDGYEDVFSSPEIAVEDEEVLEEGAKPEEAISAFIRETTPGKDYYAKEVNDIFSNLRIFDSYAKLAILRRLPATGNITVMRDESGTACLMRTEGGMPNAHVHVDEKILQELVNPSGLTPDISSEVRDGAGRMARPKFMRY